MRGGGWPGLVLGAISIGIGLWQWYSNSEKAAKAEQKNEKQMRKAEWKAQVQHLKQLNQALARGMGGTVLAEKKLLEAQRERTYQERNYGEPVKN